MIFAIANRIKRLDGGIVSIIIKIIVTIIIIIFVQDKNMFFNQESF